MPQHSDHHTTRPSKWPARLGVLNVLQQEESPEIIISYRAFPLNNVSQVPDVSKWGDEPRFAVCLIFPLLGPNVSRAAKPLSCSPTEAVLDQTAARLL